MADEYADVSAGGRAEWPTRVVDLLFALGLGGLMAFYLVPMVGSHRSGPLTLLCWIVAAGCLALVPGRRERPLRLLVALILLSALIVANVVMPAWLLLLPPGLFCVEAYEPREAVRRWVVPVLGVLAVVLLAGQWVWTATAATAIMLLSLIGWARGVRVARSYRQSLLDRVAVAERERDLRAQQAVEAERVRIARDIHDVVSHSLAVVAVQAAGAERIVDRDPARAKEAMAVIGRTARDALTEMRAMLEVLRAGHPEAGPEDAPSPGLPEIGSLVDGLRSGGLPATFEQTGQPYRLAPGVELAVHRVAQEALTNAVKHGRTGADASVRLDYGPDQLALEVCSALAVQGAADGGLPGGGSGQVGMRERLEIYGGTLRIRQEAGRYVVVATVPRTGPSPPAGGES